MIGRVSKQASSSHTTPRFSFRAAAGGEPARGESSRNDLGGGARKSIFDWETCRRPVFEAHEEEDAEDGELKLGGLRPEAGAANDPFWVRPAGQAPVTRCPVKWKPHHF